MPDHRGPALEYAARGWSVFPIIPRKKTPMSANGFKDATTDPDAINAWWTRTPDANIGVATGAASGIYVIDLDGPTGLRSWRDLTAEHGAPTKTLLGRTGGGGWHLVYAATGLPNTAGKLGQKIDTRGDGGYIVAPPSIHPNGDRYLWHHRMDPAPLPEWIKEILKPRQRETPAGEVAVHRLATGNTPYGVAALERHAREIRQAPEGARNDTLNVAAFALAQLVAGGELVASDTRWELEQAAVDAGLGRQEARGTIDSGMTAGMKEPRSAPHRDIEPPTIDIPRIKVARL